MSIKGLTKVEYQREYMKEKRSKDKGLLTRPNMMIDGKVVMKDNEYNANERLSDGRMRYLGPMSDGQVLDRLTAPRIPYGKWSQRVFTPNKEQLIENGMLKGVQRA